MSIVARQIEFAKTRDNYAGYLSPRLMLISRVLLMGIVLVLRPRGLFPLEKA